MFSDSDDVGSCDLSTQSLESIAAVVKKYLREIPEPIIPTAFYEQFIQISSECFAESLSAEMFQFSL